MKYVVDVDGRTFTVDFDGDAARVDGGDPVTAVAEDVPNTPVRLVTIGGTLAPTAGGTGITSFAVGDLLFANTTTSLDKLTVGSNGYLLASNGTAPQYVNPTSVTIGKATNLAGGEIGRAHV